MSLYGFIITDGCIIIAPDANMHIATYHGWTNMDSRDSCSFRGTPPESELRNLGSTRLRKAKMGILDVPHYPSPHHGSQLWLQGVENKLFADGKRDEYIANIRWTCQKLCEGKDPKSQEGDVEWRIMTSDGNIRCSAILLSIGHSPYVRSY
jgi:hypothetical protein